MRTGSDGEERRNPGGVNSHPEGTEHPTTVGHAAAGSVESGVAPSVAVPAGELGRTVAREAVPLGTRQAPESADVHTEPTGEPDEETAGAGGWPVTSRAVAAELAVSHGDADSVGADNAAVAEGVALPAGSGEDAVEVAGEAATLAAAPPLEVGGWVESGLPPKPRRISKPMLAAAAIAGIVLIAVPFALGGLLRHGTRGTGADAAAFSSGGSSSSGFVPSPETGIPQIAGAPGASQTAQVPAPGQPAGAPTKAAAVTGAAQPAPLTPLAQPAPPPHPAPSPQPAPPPPATSSATSANGQISGQVSCTSGNSVEGVWVAAAQGSGFARWQGLGNGSTSNYWYTLPTSEPYSLHVGCGGTPSSWAVAAYSPQVSGTQNSFNCIDVAGQPGYATCVVR